MKRKVKGYTRLALALLLVLTSTTIAQWPDDPAANFMLTMTPGSASIPHVAATSDGGCYIGWWDNSVSQYNFYMQRLDKDGYPQWGVNGRIISDHPQQTWLTEWSIAVDDSDCAIVAIYDIRNGGDWDIYAYRMDTLGAQRWGADGLTISDNDIDDFTPHVTVTSLGNIVFAWQEDTIVHVRKVSPAGLDLWSPAVKDFAGEYPFSNPDLAPTNDDGVFLQLLVHQEGGLFGHRDLYIHKYDADGNDVWDSNGVLICDVGFGGQMRPRVASDGAGGAFSYWYTGPGMVFHAYAQHIRSDGTIAWTANGEVVSTTLDRMQGQPELAFHPATGDIMLFYVETNEDQYQWGVYGQKFDSLGVRQWGDGGIEFEALNDRERRQINSCAVQNDGVIIYSEKALDEVTFIIKAIRVDGSGIPVWGSEPLTIASAPSQKDHLDICVNSFDQVISVWEDDRYDRDGDAFLQDVNPDGSLGPLVATIGRIAGTVIDSHGAAPLEGAIVTTYDSLDTVVAVDTTSPRGQYILALANAGTYHESFTKTGYRDTTFSDIVVVIGDTAYVLLAMQSAGGCSYAVGDANGNGSFNGLDVTYSVAYFKGGPPPPYECECTPGNTWYVAGDVNQSCGFNGLDVTYMVAYFKGGPLPHPCPDCRPTELLAPPTPGATPNPAVQPMLVPAQKAQPKAGGAE